MTTRQKRKERITRTRQKQILDAALAVFSARGFGEASVSDIAEQAGIGVGTIYNYYKDKQDLLISLIAQNLISQDLVKILGSAPPRAGGEFLRSLLEERLAFGLDNAQKILFLMFEIQRDPGLRRNYVSQVVSPLLGKIEKYINEQVKNGAFRKVDARIVARTLTGSIIGNMILYRLEQRESPLKKSHVKEAAAELSNLFLHGLEAE
jgi:AcrR family transcriptional regulator